MSNLPHGWTQVELPDIAALNPGMKLSQEDETAAVSFIPMRAISPEGGGITAPEQRQYGEVKRGYTAFQSGDILMAKITPCMENGKTALVPSAPAGPWFGSTEFHVVRPAAGILGNWIEAYLLRQDVRAAAQRSMSGAVGQMRVPADFLASLRLPLAPTNEQRRIADALDELLSDLDAGVAALERARAKLALYRAAVLKAAVEGTLTADWRVEHPDAEPASKLLERILVERRRKWEKAQLAKFKEKGKTPPKGWRSKYKEPVAPDVASLPPLPEGWCWATLDQLGKLDRGKSKHRPRDAAFLYGGPYPFIQTGDVKRARQYVREHTQTYSEAGLAQSRLWPEQTLCITIAANIAETAILAYPACFPDSVVGILVDHNLVSVRYLELFMRHAKSRIAAYAPATAQKNINNAILRAVAVPLPSWDEQTAMVDALEERISVTEHMEDAIDAKLAASKSLRHSILRHAFSGKLVPQDPDDEPASELLKRIAAEREAKPALSKEIRRPAKRARMSS